MKQAQKYSLRFFLRDWALAAYACSPPMFLFLR